MANDRHEDIELHPSFFRPPNVINLREKNQEDGGAYYSLESSPSPGVGDPIGDDQVTRPMPPTSFSVVSQQVRTLPDGRQVVDVVLELPDQPGVTEYDIRVAKTE